MGKVELIISDYISNPHLFKLFFANMYNEIIRRIYYLIIPDKVFVNKLFKKHFGRNIDFEHPKTLNEKIQCLKLKDRDDFYTMCADKYAVRQYIRESFGEEYLVPLLYETTDFRDLVPDNIPDCNCIIKANNGCAGHVIVRESNRNKLNYPEIREHFRHILHSNYYYPTREWQYKNMKPRIIIEKLLETKDGKIPNDYKLHYINGQLQFVYVSYDREGVNDRCIFDKNWERLPFMWIGAESYRPSLNTSIVPRPDSFEKMKEFGAIVAKRFKLVRVDFYDVDGKLYFGEITLHHGSGRDKFFPEEYDLKFGEILKL